VSEGGAAGEAAAFWEERYAGSDRIWSGHVNPVLADIAAALPPGVALDLGCGEGGDVVWLAEHGWSATGVDLSPTAIARARAAASAAGIPPDAARFEAADLSTWTAPPQFDLVAASFLQSWPAPIPRDDILRRATGFVAPGGRVLVVAHASSPSWADPEIARLHGFPSPAEDLAALAVDVPRADGTSWRVELCELRTRAVTAPDGSAGTIDDSVVLVHRIR
jgi:SAM-dependent methyltransferase